LFSRRPSLCIVVHYHAFTRVAVVLPLPGEWRTFRSGASPLVHLHSAGPTRPVPLGTSCWVLGLKNPVGSGSVKVNYTQPYNAGVSNPGEGGCRLWLVGCWPNGRQGTMMNHRAHITLNYSPKVHIRALLSGTRDTPALLAAGGTTNLYSLAPLHNVARQTMREQQMARP
jgi:hypothetical protein